MEATLTTSDLLEAFDRSDLLEAYARATSADEMIVAGLTDSTEELAAKLLALGTPCHNCADVQPRIVQADSVVTAEYCRHCGVETNAYDTEA